MRIKFYTYNCKVNDKEFVIERIVNRYKESAIYIYLNTKTSLHFAEEDEIQELINYIVENNLGTEVFKNLK